MLDFIFGIVTNVINFIISALAGVINFVFSFLPNSPFLNLNKVDSDVLSYLPYVSYFFPVKLMFATLTAWLACMLIYFIYSVVMRWIKLM
ncbi:hypothetical protein KGF42_18415 [Clostridioides sp. ZZV15-6383]|uniref:hypothetical protein n=1 Tax=Clostridioides sp. ZZV15-6383 TaxID=2811498 RepID=UPI001D10DDC8|nr:hypothetical protein [Clostridioides sp. ZZV15-6383]